MRKQYRFMLCGQYGQWQFLDTAAQLAEFTKHCEIFAKNGADFSVEFKS